MERAFKYATHIQEIPHIREDLGFLGPEWAISESEARQILVIIEELFSNIVRFAFDDELEHFVVIRLFNLSHQVEIEIIDDGIPFNPLTYQTRALANPVSSDSGGMGLTLIRTFSNKISYKRDGGKNHLFITKKLKTK